MAQTDGARPVRHITIVGGGTAGWLAATMLSAFFGVRKNAGPDAMRITLIESPSVPTVGVGEATVPSMPHTLRQTGIEERAFFKACNASFKLGVRFCGWNVDGKGEKFDFINPFNVGVPVAGHDPGYYYARYGAGGLSFVQTISPAEDLANALKGPRPLGEKPFGQNAGYAYHLDAGLFAKLLRDVCTGRGVEHVLDDMVEVERGEDGNVAALHLKEKGRFPVELVIDCTGFRGLIVNGALGEPFVSYANHLANDRAMAVQIPHPDPERIEPMTRATALGAGWSWRVPLYNRLGTGYVFSSAHRTDEEARDEFVAFLGDARPKDAEPRVIPMRVGRARNAWVRNCIAIGLAGGFIEPLESTAIFTVEMAIRWLLSYFPDTSYPDSLRDRYNEVSGAFYDEVRDFIVLHYALGNRTDSQYWIDAREGLEMPASLAANLELWRHALPNPSDLASAHLFTAEVYTAVLLGKRAFTESPATKSRTLGRDTWRQYLAFHRRRVDQALAQLPGHVTLLRELRGETDRAPAAGPAIRAPAPQAGTVPLPGLGAPIQPRLRAAAPARRPAPAAPSDGGNLL